MKVAADLGKGLLVVKVGKSLNPKAEPKLAGP